MERMERNVNIMETINRLMSFEDKIRFNIFYLIAESENSLWATDDQSYIIGQTNENLPMWIWMKDDPDETACGKVKTMISERLELNPALKVTAEEEKIEDILEQIAEEKQIKFKRNIPMNIYYCNRLAEGKTASGHIILSDESHKETLKRFITGMVDDLEHRPMQDGEAEGFAEGVAGSQDLFLWEQEKTVVAMAMITHRTEEFARINTVYTDSAKRRKGYGGMLVGAVTQKILEEKRTPMLYTEQDNVSSNAMYRRIGYQLCGQLTQFVFEASK